MKNIRGALFVLSLSIILLFNSTTIAQAKAAAAEAATSAKAAAAEGASQAATAAKAAATEAAAEAQAAAAEVAKEVAQEAAKEVAKEAKNSVKDQIMRLRDESSDAFNTMISSEYGSETHTKARKEYLDKSGEYMALENKCGFDGSGC